jgi:agarase
VSHRLAGLLVLAALISLTLKDSAVAAVAKTGFYRIESENGVAWLVDPAGVRTISAGVDGVGYRGNTIGHTDRAPYREACEAKYGSEGAWREAAARRLDGWGFNTLGSWSDPQLAGVAVGHGRHLAYAVTLDLGAHFVAHRTGDRSAWEHGVFPDVFDPEFAQFVAADARRQIASLADDANVLGWFTDNELRWGPDWRGHDELIVEFLNLPAGTPGREAAVALLHLRHPDLAALNAAWGTAFADWTALSAGKDKVSVSYSRRKLAKQNTEDVRATGGGAFFADCDAFLSQLAERYFHDTDAAIAAAAPHQLRFGCRFAYPPGAPVVAAAARYLDAISFNCYNEDPRGVIGRYSVFHKPMIIGEFSFRGLDSGLPNTKGAGARVPTQADRAKAFESFVREALGEPLLIGYHWFTHVDEPAEGRFDGENSNYGVVNIRDEPYAALVETMTRINGEAVSIHAKATGNTGVR